MRSRSGRRTCSGARPPTGAPAIRGRGPRSGCSTRSGRTVLVQGAGSVGARVIQELLAAGAKVLAADVDPARVAATGADPIAPDAALTTPCDVLSPCATGAVLSAATI